MEEKIEKVFSRELSIRQFQDPGDLVAWGVFYGDRLIGAHKTRRAARIALLDAEVLRQAIYDVLRSKDYNTMFAKDNLCIGGVNYVNAMIWTDDGAPAKYKVTINGVLYSSAETAYEANIIACSACIMLQAFGYMTSVSFQK